MALAIVAKRERTERGHSPRPLGTLKEGMTKSGSEQDIVTFIRNGTASYIWS
jgi:hypothetical protein